MRILKNLAKNKIEVVAESQQELSAFFWAASRAKLFYQWARQNLSQSVRVCVCVAQHACNLWHATAFPATKLCKKSIGRDSFDCVHFYLFLRPIPAASSAQVAKAGTLKTRSHRTMPAQSQTGDRRAM